MNMWIVVFFVAFGAAFITALVMAFGLQNAKDHVAQEKYFRGGAICALVMILIIMAAGAAYVSGLFG